MTNAPSVLVFDVNETLLDLRALEPHFERVFGHKIVLREWFGQVIQFAEAVTLAKAVLSRFGVGATHRGFAEVQGTEPRKEW